jgi:hypothetical protein
MVSVVSKATHAIELSMIGQAVLEAMARSCTSPHRQVTRVRMVVAGCRARSQGNGCDLAGRDAGRTERLQPAAPARSGSSRSDSSSISS